MTKKATKKVAVQSETIAVTRNGDKMNIKPELLEHFLAAGWKRA